MAALSHVHELARVAVTDTGLVVGAGVSLTRLMALLKDQVATQPAHKTRGFAAAAEQLRWFAGRLVWFGCGLGVVWCGMALWGAGMPGATTAGRHVLVPPTHHTHAAHRPSDPQHRHAGRQHRDRQPHLRPQPALDGLWGDLHARGGWGPARRAGSRVFPRIQVCDGVSRMFTAVDVVVCMWCHAPHRPARPAALTLASRLPRLLCLCA